MKDKEEKDSDNQNINEEFEEEEREEDLNLEEKNINKYTRIGNQIYDVDTLNRITIVRLSQVGVPPKQIRTILKVSRALVSKWVNYKKREPKKWEDQKIHRKAKRIFM